ncbi:hypothetical protein CR513_42256, partial [Mucuna pruriens]
MIGLPIDSREQKLDQNEVEERKKKQKEKKERKNKGEKRKKDVMSKATMCLKDSKRLTKKKDEKQMLESFLDVYSKDIPHRLPPIKGREHQIDFNMGAILPNRATYRANTKESIEIFPCVVPVILVSKKDGSWRMCMDCRSINAITDGYRHLIHHLENLLDELHSKIVLCSGYYEIRI